jgi:hypothetical protein
MAAVLGGLCILALLREPVIMSQYFFRCRTQLVAAAAAVATLAALAGCGAGDSSSTAHPVAGTPLTGTVSAAIGPAGGRIANQAGVVLDVPMGVLKSAAAASITPEPGGAWDVHIAATWSGTVAVTLPTGADADQALLGHQVNGVWRIEPAIGSHDALTAHVKSLSLFKVLKCLIGTPNAGRIARCMIDAGIATLALKTLSKKAAKWLLNIFAPTCVDIIGGAIDFAQQKIFGIPPSQCTAVDGQPSSGTAGPGQGSSSEPPATQPASSQTQPPAAQPTQPGAAPEQLTVMLTEDPFRCDGGTREVGYVSGAAPGERVQFSSPQLGPLSTGTAGSDGRVPLNWVCQPSDAGTSWQIVGRGASGVTVSFTVTAAPGGAPPSSSSGPQVYWYNVYHTCANGKCGLRLHSGPGFSSYPVTRVLVDGDAVGIVCQARGEPVSGIDGSSSDVWDRLVEGDWAADFYVDTPGTTGSFSPPIPAC